MLVVYGVFRMVICVVYVMLLCDDVAGVVCVYVVPQHTLMSTLVI